MAQRGARYPSHGSTQEHVVPQHQHMTQLVKADMIAVTNLVMHLARTSLLSKLSYLGRWCGRHCQALLINHKPFKCFKFRLNLHNQCQFIARRSDAIHFQTGQDSRTRAYTIVPPRRCAVATVRFCPKNSVQHARRCKPPDRAGLACSHAVHSEVHKFGSRLCVLPITVLHICLFTVSQPLATREQKP